LPILKNREPIELLYSLLKKACKGNPSLWLEVSQQQYTTFKQNCNTDVENKLFGSGAGGMLVS
jgi:hypothetical protein